MTGADALRGGCKNGERLPAPGLIGDCPKEPWLLAGVSSPPCIPVLLTAKGSMRGTKGLIGRALDEVEEYVLLIVDDSISSGSSTIAVAEAVHGQRCVPYGEDERCLPGLQT